MPDLRYGRGTAALDIPSSKAWDSLTYPGTDRAASPQLSLERIRRSLAHPLASPPLREAAAGHSRAVILISDGTRPCPNRLMLPLLLQELTAAGIADEQVDIVVALGAHRRHTEKELIELVGEEIADRVRIHNHSSDPEDCVFVGTTKLGTPVEINRLVAEAPFRIATGNIQPHALAGISGGAKALVPGAASRRTIEYNHGLSLKYPGKAGKADNPLYADMVEAQSFTPIHFILNVILNHENEVLDSFAGDLVETHRSGARLAARYFLLPVRELYDVVVVSAGGAPRDLQLYQALKSLRNAAAFTRPGGKVLLIAECREMLGSGVLQDWLETMPDLQRSTNALKEHFVLGAHKLLHVEEIVNRVQVHLYSSLSPHWVDLLGFSTISDPNEWLRRTLAEQSDLSLAVMPFGSLTFPQPSEEA
ncbi:nickel-dependent lactate racemase [Paenibacillus sp. S-38]|uniref:nickel-dependent lactate racemase n=1 Tax=Paenibacillus sp. S-38 TaxID=3416710 RepID=UPI003CEEAD88